MTSKTAMRSLWSTTRDYVATLLLVGIATGISYALAPLTAASSLALVYVTAVSWIALRYGLWPSVAASFLSIGVWDFLFIPPFNSFLITDPRDVLALIVFLLAALILSSIAAGMRNQAAELAARETTLRRLYQFSLSLAGISSLEGIAEFATGQLSIIFGCQAVLLIPGPDRDSTIIRPAGSVLSAADMRDANLVWKRSAAGEPAGDGRSSWSFSPIEGPHGRIGVAGLRRTHSPIMDPQGKLLFDALLGQLAIAIARIQLVNDLQKERLTAETERLRNALLTSISHDLRTPLTSIIIALSTLESGFRFRTIATKREMVATALREAMRLDRFIGNLLSMTRIEAGMLKLKPAPTDLVDVVEAAADRARPLLQKHKLQVSLSDDLPLVSGDFALLEQVFFNLLDNASKYSPEGSTLAIQGSEETGNVVVEVLDEGRGIPADKLSSIFSRFNRIEQVDKTTPGTGLGLAICRGFLNAMGGSITAANRLDRTGAVFTVMLPAIESAQEPREKTETVTQPGTTR